MQISRNNKRETLSAGVAAGWSDAHWVDACRRYGLAKLDYSKARNGGIVPGSNSRRDGKAVIAVVVAFSYSERRQSAAQGSRHAKQDWACE